MDFDEFYESCNKPQKRLLDSLKMLEKPIIASELAEMSNISVKNFSVNMNPLVNIGIVKMKEVSPKGKKVRYKYYSLESIEKISLIECIVKKPVKKNTGVKLIKQTIDIDSIKNDVLKQLKQEVNEKNDEKKRARKIISKFITTVAIREQDKRAMKLNGTNQDIRNDLLDLLDLL